MDWFRLVLSVNISIKYGESYWFSEENSKFVVLIIGKGFKLRQRLRDHYLIIILIVINILFAVFFGSDFGESWDDQSRYNVAVEAIENYSNLEPSNQIGGKGPIYYVAAKMGGDLIQMVNPRLTHIQAWHFIHFLSFILGVIAFYLISLRFLSPKYAFIAAALFNTQPLLFGHAFINPKDIPFMSSFLLILASGLLMGDQFKGEFEKSDIKINLKLIKIYFVNDWFELKIIQIFILLLFGTISFTTISLLLFQTDYIQRLIQNTINQIKLPALFTLVDNIASSVLNGTISGGISHQNVEKAYSLFVVIWGIIILLGLMALVVYLFPRVFQFFSGFSSKKQFLSGLLSVLKTGWVYTAAIILGLAINNRSLSITAGIFVLFYIWIKKRSFFLPTILVYFGIAFLTLYITWPGLWGNPFTGLIKSLLADSSFSWGGTTLFRGYTYQPEVLPFYYLPFLMAIQFTVPVILLTVLGLFAVVREFNKNIIDHTLLFILVAWYIVPIGLAIIVKPTIYNNFRHFLFTTPPIFFFSGIGIKTILKYISRRAVSIVIILIMLAPGIIGIIRLHPYQYIYYNQFVGGVSGAFRSFENDYWVTSFQECIEYINQVADKHDVILVYGPTDLVENSLRDDLIIVSFKIKNYGTDNDRHLIQTSDYMIMPSRMNNDLLLFPEMETVFSVNISGAILCIVKDMKE